jgi:ABC-2 type transport system ATP-binding protein
MVDKILQVANVHKSFGSKKVLNEVNIDISPGEVFGFLGPNGAGKTTTVRVILSLVRPDQGTVMINGYNIKERFKQAIACVGAVVETPKFYLYLSGYQNILLMANLHRNIPRSRIEQVLKIAGLTERAQDPVGTYSLGMKQRLGIARALINDPKLIFLDEPMNGLDPQGIFEVRELIRRLANEQGTTFFLTSHLLHEVEQVCNRIAILNKGQILIQGSVDDLLANDSETVEIHTKETSRTQQALQEVAYIRRFTRLDEHRVIVEIDKGLSGRLNRHLINLGIEVEYLVPNNQSLENLYMELIQGDSYDL